MRFQALVLVLAVFTASSATAAEPISIAVMEFTSKGGVTQDQMDALSDMLSNQLRSMGNFKVIGKSDIRSMLTLEEQKQRLSSCTDQSCLAEIGGALGVRWVVVGNVSLFGKTYLLNLKLIDVEGVSVASGVSRSIEGGEDRLLAELPGAAKEMFDAVADRLGMAAEKKPPEEKKPAEEKKKIVEKKEVVKKTEPPQPPKTGWFSGPAEREGKWSLWGLGSFVYLIGGGGSGEEASYASRMENAAIGGQLGAGIGYSFLEWLALEIQLGGHYLSGDDDRSNWAVDLSVGLRATWPIDSIIQPLAFLGAGAGVVRDKPQEVAGDEYNIWGAGPLVYFGLGADLYFTPNWYGGLRLRGTLWIYDIVEKEDHDIDAWVKLFGASVVGVTGWQF